MNLKLHVYQPKIKGRFTTHPTFSLQGIKGRISPTCTYAKEKHKDLKEPSKRKDEADVQLMIEILENGWTNPFGNNSELLSLLTGAAASQEVTRDLLSAKAQGESDYKTFSKNRLETKPPDEKFHETNRLF